MSERLRGLFAHRAAKRFDERWIKGRAGLLFEHRQGFFDGHRNAVWFVGGEGVEGLRKCHDSRQERDVSFFQAERVAGAVPAFVMQGNDLHGFGGKSHGASDACTEVGVMVDPVIIVVEHGASFSGDQIEIMGQGAK